MYRHQSHAHCEKAGCRQGHLLNDLFFRKAPFVVLDAAQLGDHRRQRVAQAFLANVVVLKLLTNPAEFFVEALSATSETANKNMGKSNGIVNFVVKSDPQNFRDKRTIETKGGTCSTRLFHPKWCLQHGSND
jgi:hypothetical protein